MRQAIALVAVLALAVSPSLAAPPSPLPPLNLTLSGGEALALPGNLAPTPRSLGIASETPLPRGSPVGLVGELRRDPGGIYLAHIALKLHF